jgi:dephospho-CoA kinase
LGLINRLENLKGTTNMLKVGITGGIGSGKTTVCKIFELLGIPVYYADERAKLLMTEDKKVVEAVKEVFGEQTYLPDGTLNRAYLAKIVFQNNSQLERLNAIVHPAVYKDGESWHEAQKDVPFTLKEAALFFENGSNQFMDKMICVTAPEQIRIKRVMERDNTTEAAVLARMNKQLPESEKVQQSDYVIYNDGSQSLISQVWSIYSDLKNQLNQGKP